MLLSHNTITYKHYLLSNVIFSRFSLTIIEEKVIDFQVSMFLQKIKKKHSQSIRSNFSKKKR